MQLGCGRTRFAGRRESDIDGSGKFSRHQGQEKDKDVHFGYYFEERYVYVAVVCELYIAYCVVFFWGGRGCVGNR